MEVKQNDGEIFISQRKYAKEILKKFSMENCKSMNTPICQKEKLCKDDISEQVDETLQKLNWLLDVSYNNKARYLVCDKYIFKVHELCQRISSKSSKDSVEICQRNFKL